MSNEKLAADGLRALHYVQNEIRQLSSISLTPEGKHTLLVFRLMLRQVWRKEFRDGEFVFLEERSMSLSSELQNISDWILSHAAKGDSLGPRPGMLLAQVLMDLSRQAAQLEQLPVDDVCLTFHGGEIEDSL